MPAELTPGTRISTTGGFDRGSSTASGLHTAGTEADLCRWRFRDVLIPRTLREPLRNARCRGKAVEARGPRAACRRWPRSDAAPPTALASLVWSWRLGLCGAFPTPPPLSLENAVSIVTLRAPCARLAFQRCHPAARRAHASGFRCFCSLSLRVRSVT